MTDASNSKTVPEIILIQESTLQGCVRDASTFALFAGLIGLGVLVDSSAMQWTGFFFATIVTIGRATGRVKRITREEAIERLRRAEVSHVKYR